MPKKKIEEEPLSWEERLLNPEQEDAPATAAESTQFMPSAEMMDAMSRALAAEKKARVLELKAKVLERELYLAKARILELEIQNMEQA